MKENGVKKSGYKNEFDKKILWVIGQLTAGDSSGLFDWKCRLSPFYNSPFLSVRASTYGFLYRGNFEKAIDLIASEEMTSNAFNAWSHEIMKETPVP